MVAIIQFIPGAYYIGAAVGGAVLGWLTSKSHDDTSEELDPHALPVDDLEEKEDTKSEMRRAADGLDNLSKDDNDDDYIFSERPSILDIKGD